METYTHGNYEFFIVYDPKQREIAVASIRDRVVHRLVYDYLVPIWDKSFCYGAWSCRKNKGLLGAIDHAHTNIRKYQDGWLWRSDIAKFFDSINHEQLKFILGTKSKDDKILQLMNKIIDSYQVVNRAGTSTSYFRPESSSVGLPIGNLTSQIFANIYLNEFDQFILHTIKPLGYTRYGDDFVIWFPTELDALTAQIVATQFLGDILSLRVNQKHDKVQKTCHKLSYLGVELWPNGKRLQKRVVKRIDDRLSLDNAASYYALAKRHMPARYQKQLLHKILAIIEQMW